MKSFKKGKKVNKTRTFGSCALSGKILLLRIVKNNQIDANFRAGQVQ